jgi:hypothetical protein
MMKVSIKDCARCGTDHNDLEFNKFIGDPIECDDHVYTHWGKCPVSGDPILMYISYDLQPETQQVALPEV